MLSLHDHLLGLAANSRAVAWTLRSHAGWSGSAPVRVYEWFAPANAEGARAVLARVHNSMILLNPALSELEAPVGEARLQPLLGALRDVHHVPIVLRGEPLLPPTNEDGMDIPSVDISAGRTPMNALAAGLDIGGTGMKACLLRDGQVVRVASGPTWPDGERGVESLIRRARALIAEVAAGETPGSLGIGFASPMAVGGRVTELSTVMRDKVGNPRLLDDFAARCADGLVLGPVAMFNDLANLGRYLSARGARRMVRLQIGTSFGGCWIDSNGTVYATEMGRLIIDAGPDAIPHTYLPIAGAVRQYLSNLGLSMDLERRLGTPFDPRRVGHALREGLERGETPYREAVDRFGDAMIAVVHELHDLLPGVTRVEVGGSMLAGPTGKALLSRVADRVPVEFDIAAQPGHDGAIAAAQAPRVDAALKGMKRVG